MRQIVGMLALLWAGAAAGQSGPPDGTSAGISAVISTNPYIGESSQAVPIPLFIYRNGPLEVSTNGLGYRLWEQGAFSVTAAARPRFSGLLNTDGPELDGIDRTVTGDLALEARYDRGFAFAAGSVRQEFTGEHDGQELRFRLGARVPLGGRAGLALAAGAAYQTSELSEYVYGVRAAEARPGRAAYDPGDVVIPFVSAVLRLPVSERATVTATVRTDFLPSDVTDSPIIEDDTLVSGILGISWRF